MMFSKEYFKYLLTSNRYLLILVFFLFAFNAIGNTIKGLDLLLQGFLAILFSTSMTRGRSILILPCRSTGRGSWLLPFSSVS